MPSTEQPTGVTAGDRAILRAVIGVGLISLFVVPLAPLYSQSVALDLRAAFRSWPHSLDTLHHGFGWIWPGLSLTTMAVAAWLGARWPTVLGRVVRLRHARKSLAFGWYPLVIGAHLSPVGWLALVLSVLVFVPTTGLAANRLMDGPPRPVGALGLATWWRWVVGYGVAMSVTVAGTIAIIYLVAAPTMAAVPNLAALEAWARANPEDATAMMRNLSWARWFGLGAFWGWIAVTTAVADGFLPGFLVERAWEATAPAPPVTRPDA